MARPIALVLACAALLGGCATGPLGRLTDALSPWPTYGSSQALLASDRTLAPETGLTVRRVAEGPQALRAGDGALGVQASNPWPPPATRQNTLADFERTLHDGTPPPPPPGTRPEASSP